MWPEKLSPPLHKALQQYAESVYFCHGQPCKASRIGPKQGFTGKNKFKLSLSDGTEKLQAKLELTGN